MPLAAFLHTPCHGAQRGRVHYLHYHCNVIPVEAGRVHHHMLLIDLAIEDSASVQFPTHPEATTWTQPANDWSTAFTRTLPIVLPGRVSVIRALPMATRRESSNLKENTP